ALEPFEAAGGALQPFEATRATFPAGTWVLHAAQPYRSHLKDMMERQVYPERLTAGAKAEPPYDVAGWTLPLQMGVRVVEVGAPLTIKQKPLDSIDTPGPSDSTGELLQRGPESKPRVRRIGL